jgi:hypothetical protein
MTLLKRLWTRRGTFWIRSSHTILGRVELDLKQIEVVFNYERGRQCPTQLAMNTEALLH